MKRSLIAVTCLCLLMFILQSCDSSNAANDKKENNSPFLSKEEQINRGKYLLSIGGCGDCHTPKKMTPMGPVHDSSKLYSGNPEGSPFPAPDQKIMGMVAGPDITSFAGPWGVSFAANLTPDTTTGIGNWSEATFINTLRTGKHLGLEGGRPILPPMPFPNFKRLTDEDFRSIYSFLQSIPPIKNKVHEPIAPNPLGNK